jgi:hypothetical protein
LDNKKHDNSISKCIDCVTEIIAYIEDYEKKINTNFDKYRNESIKIVSNQLSNNFKDKLLLNNKEVEVKDYCMFKFAIGVFKNYTEEPIFTYPNFHLWMLSDNEPVGMSSIDLGEILWSDRLDERGQLCFKSVNLDIKVYLKVVYTIT